MTRPSTLTLPAVACSKPPTIYSSVLFPQPLGPRIDTNWPSGTCNEMSRMAVCSVPRAVWKVFPSCSIVIIACGPIENGRFLALASAVHRGGRPGRAPGKPPAMADTALLDGCNDFFAYELRDINGFGKDARLVYPD